MPPIIFLKWKKNLDQGALTQRVQDAATDTESSQPEKAQDVRKEEVFTVTVIMMMKTRVTDQEEVLEVPGSMVTGPAEVLVDRAEMMIGRAGVLETNLSEESLMMIRREESQEKEGVTEISQGLLETGQEGVLEVPGRMVTGRAGVLGDRAEMMTGLAEMMTGLAEILVRKGRRARMR